MIFFPKQLFVLLKPIQNANSMELFCDLAGHGQQNQDILAHSLSQNQHKLEKSKTYTQIQNRE